MLQDMTAGPSFLATQLIEVGLIAGAFPLFLRAVGLRSALGSPCSSPPAAAAWAASP